MRRLQHKCVLLTLNLCVKRTVIPGDWPNVIRFLSPPIITQAHVDRGVDIFSDAVKEAEHESS